MPCGTAVLTAVPVARAPGGSRHEPGARATGSAGKGSLSCTEPWASSAFLHCHPTASGPGAWAGHRVCRGSKDGCGGGDAAAAAVAAPGSWRRQHWAGPGAALGAPQAPRRRRWRRRRRGGGTGLGGGGLRQARPLAGSGRGPGVPGCAAGAAAAAMVAAAAARGRRRRRRPGPTTPSRTLQIRSN